MRPRPDAWAPVPLPAAVARASARAVLSLGGFLERRRPLDRRPFRGSSLADSRAGELRSLVRAGGGGA
eukprot:7656448-Alexandrium_andersonii.AAC.1